MKSLEDYISEQLVKHLNIDYNVLENAGLYDGIEDLCKFLTNKIKSHQEKEFTISYKDSDRELSNMNNIFFKNIILKCERSNKNNNDAEYYNNDIIDFDKESDKFNYIKLYLHLSQKHIADEVYSILLHEITHAWDNYNSCKKHSTTLKDSIKQSKYIKILSYLDSTGPKQKLGQILYFLNEIEVNAWVASFAGYLYNYMEENTINNPHKALEIIKKSDLYKNYINIGEYINALYNNDKRLSKEFVHEICQSYNEIYNTNYTEYKIKKLLYTRYNKVMNKIESNIGKICTKYIKDLRLR